MTEVCRRMLSDEDDTPDKCRKRRRRRIEMRRLAVISGANSPPQPPNQNPRENPSRPERSADSKWIGTVEKIDLPVPSTSSSGDDVEAFSAPESEGPVSEPVFGTMSVSGRSREMEDAIAVRTSLCRPEISTRRPVHFFAVFDGHGGPHVAALCRERMHEFVEEELTRVSSTGKSESGSGSSSRDGNEKREGLEERWRRAMRRSFERMDEVALRTCACGSVGNKCKCHPMEVALGGSTAVVALLSTERIVVANCGDSRAVLCRAGTAIPLSQDHKPDRSDELARIEAAGGRVIFVNGARVEGILAMSRAIGDKYLKPFVTSEPEITFTKREPEDECLILASDGLWDVLSSELACEVARECLREGTPAHAAAIVDSRSQMEDGGAGALYPSRSALAAALLTRLALGRQSSDNISVIVVDLKSS